MVNRRRLFRIGFYWLIPVTEKEALFYNQKLHKNSYFRLANNLNKSYNTIISNYSEMPNLYIIAGCNGAGKTTASYTVLPEILNCKEFVNADIIAAGISPFNVEGVALEAGRIMLNRINELIKEEVDFAFETTLATRSYISMIRKARDRGFKVILLYFWLDSPEQAQRRVAKRVASGGHHIPDDVVARRYIRGVVNLFALYMPVCDEWMVFNNMDVNAELIAKSDSLGKEIYNTELWIRIEKQGHDKH
jgi:predicted ABC-type ATPase